MHLWEFNKDVDTAKSYQGFTCYRDLGPKRSLESGYQIYKHYESIKTVPGFFREWCQKGQWVDRAHSFDLESDRIRVERMQGEAHREHEQRLERVRSTAETLSITQLSTSLTVALLVQDAIDRLKVRWENSFDDVSQEVQNANFLLVLVSVKSKDVATVEASLKLADEALGISDLLDRLKS